MIYDDCYENQSDYSLREAYVALWYYILRNSFELCRDLFNYEGFRDCILHKVVKSLHKTRYINIE